MAVPTQCFQVWAEFSYVTVDSAGLSAIYPPPRCFSPPGAAKNSTADIFFISSALVTSLHYYKYCCTPFEACESMHYRPGSHRKRVIRILFFPNRASWALLECSHLADRDAVGARHRGVSALLCRFHLYLPSSNYCAFLCLLMSQTYAL